MRLGRAGWWIPAVSSVLAAGCADARVDPYVPADSGALPDAAGGHPDGGATDRPATDAATVTDATLNADAAVSDAAVPPGDGGVSCQGSDPYVITRTSVPFVLGAEVIYTLNNDGTVVDPVDTAGMPTTGGGRLWNFTAARSDDHRVLDEVVDPHGQWWASQYPSATFATLLDRASDIYGVYQVTPTALQLLATVSHAANQTNLALSPPVDVLRFPLSEGQTWTQTVTGAGVNNFTPIENVTTYTFRVDAHGEVRTPAGRFQVLRLRTDLDQSIPLTVFRRTARSYTYITDCWGVVARITSTDNETAVEFTRASEYRRLSL